MDLGDKITSLVKFGLSVERALEVTLLALEAETKQQIEKTKQAIAVGNQTKKWTDNLLKINFFEARELVNQNSMFLDNQFGSYVLERERVVELVLHNYKLQRLKYPGTSPSVYLSGCRGMGKTCDLNLIARRLQSEGWEVYWFPFPIDIPQFSGEALTVYANNHKTKKIAIVADEAASQPNNSLFLHVLKGALPNVLLVGAAVPSYVHTDITANFKVVIGSSSLVLMETDTDFQSLVDHCQNLNVTTTLMTSFVCKYLLKHCGGHVFPVLKFIEHFFKVPEARIYLASEHAFLTYFLGQEFKKSDVYSIVTERCFRELSNKQSADALDRVLSNQPNSTDLMELIRLGWWDEGSNGIISLLLLNEALRLFANSSKRVKDLRMLNKSEDHSVNMEELIVEGLSNMKQSNFEDISSTGNPVENALSFNWGISVMSLFDNAYVQFQAPGTKGYVDFYINGYCDSALEVIRNATQTANENAIPGSSDINEHLSRFLSGKYPWKRFVLFNFAMNGIHGDVPVLPENTDYHSIVYSYDHNKNCLYRGKDVIKAPAVASLPCPMPNVPYMKPLSVGPKRSFSTWNRAATAVLSFPKPILPFAQKHDRRRFRPSLALRISLNALFLCAAAVS